MIAKLGETIEPSSRNKQHEYERKLKEKLEKLVASCQVPPWSNNQTNSGLESRYQHMVAVGKLHHNSIYCMSDIISQFKMLETSTKNILVKGNHLSNISAVVADFGLALTESEFKDMTLQQDNVLEGSRLL